jgi:uncharacterized protein YjiS (DUF1127 family)
MPTLLSRRLALPFGVFRRIIRELGASAAITRSRRDLLRLDDHRLRDIGLTKAEARDEAARAAWDVPPHWQQ